MSIVDLTLAQAARAVAAKDVSPVELVDAALDRIEQIDELNAYISIFADEARALAREQADRVARGDIDGRLFGVPVSIKDNIGWAGHITAAGSRILAGWKAPEDSTVVRRLKAAGANILGTTNMHEFAWGGTSENPHYGTVRNPWNLGRTPAGSSGGSGVAVATRSCYASLGTDTGGSIRLPAAVNGLVGVRPTFGRVSNAGVVPLAWSLDATGPLTRTVEDAALVLSELAGHDPRDPGSIDAAAEDYTDGLDKGVRGLRVGVVADSAFKDVQEEVAESFEAALNQLRALGAVVREVRVPSIDGAWTALMNIHTAEPSAFHQGWLRERPNEYGDDVRANLIAGELLPATQYIQAQRFRRLLRDEFLGVLREVDVIVSPTIPYAATVVGAGEVEIRPGHVVPLVPAIIQFAGLAPVTGLPAVTVPCGIDGNGVPLGLQFLGRPMGEKTLLRAGAAFESSTDFHARKPAFIAELEGVATP